VLSGILAANVQTRKGMPFQQSAIVAQRLLRALPRRQLAMAAALLALPTVGLVTAFGIAPDTSTRVFEQASVAEAIALPELAPRPASSEDNYVLQDRVQRGDTVAAVLARVEVRDAAAIDFLRSDPVGRLIFKKLVPGRIIQAETNADGGLRTMRYFYSAEKVLEVKRTDSGFEARDRALAATPRVTHRSGTIRSSLFAATDSAGIPDAMAMQIARIFSTDIDFHQDLRKGDTFTVVYEMLYESGELIAPGRILAAEFVNQGQTYHAVLFRDEEGNDAYYSPDGTNRAKSFLRSPVEFSRVSSGFGARFHPIFKNWRAHTGVDFAAPKGTRVLSAAEGTVIFAGWKNGYGNAVEIKHGGAITTLYGHLSGFASNIRSGTRVRQGDVVGYVGATGWATGPHLHYEFKIAGVHQNPMRVALPKATPVPPAMRADFDRAARAASETVAAVRGSGNLRFE
jgi:murein DD-endopeptidase MepM/ murein hydrolase activator NlpD